MAKGPKFTYHFIPLIEALREMSGSAAAYEATDAVIERENIPAGKWDRSRFR
jgi:hypothetical protein